jgi:hypothetical protein
VAKKGQMFQCQQGLPQRIFALHHKGITSPAASRLLRLLISSAIRCTRLLAEWARRLQIPGRPFLHLSDAATLQAADDVAFCI